MFSSALRPRAALSSPARGPAPEALLRATFQLVPGLGPTRERKLWDAGVRDWSDVAALPAGLLPAALHAALATAVAAAERALAAGDLPALAALLPTREAWRLYPAFAARAIYLDIESDAEDGITAIGLLAEDEGPRILLGAHEVAGFPALVPADRLLVTFNGACFDVPVLRRHFPDWQPPLAHIDLRPVFTRLGHWGGLKAIEEMFGMPRPDHLRGLNGGAACWLWRHARLGADTTALMRFAEYNLYDAINLRPLLVAAHDRLAAATGLPCPAAPPFARGDVLYDVSKILLTLRAR